MRWNFTEMIISTRQTRAHNDYPFGSLEQERKNYSDNYRFGFNHATAWQASKENDNEVKGTGNQQDYGMRIYNPRLGRFLSADPLIVQGQQYPWYSPYQFAGNKPIQFIDLDGLEENARTEKAKFNIPPKIRTAAQNQKHLMFIPPKNKESQTGNSESSSVKRMEQKSAENVTRKCIIDPWNKAVEYVNEQINSGKDVEQTKDGYAPEENLSGGHWVDQWEGTNPQEMTSRKQMGSGEVKSTDAASTPDGTTNQYNEPVFVKPAGWGRKDTVVIPYYYVFDYDGNILDTISVEEGKKIETGGGQ